MVPYCYFCYCCPYLYFGSAIMLVTYFVNFRQLNDHLFGKELFIRFAASAFRKLPSIYVFSYFPFGFEGSMWDLIVSVPDHYLSFYFSTSSVDKKAMIIQSNATFLPRHHTGKENKQSKMLLEKSRKCHYHKPQPIPTPKGRKKGRKPRRGEKFPQ